MKNLKNCMYAVHKRGKTGWGDMDTNTQDNSDVLRLRGGTRSNEESMDDDEGTDTGDSSSEEHSKRNERPGGSQSSATNNRKKRDRSSSTPEQGPDAHVTKKSYRETKTEGLDYTDMIVQFNKCSDGLFKATSRYQSGKIQFNREEQQTVTENMHEMRRLFTLLAFEMGRNQKMQLQKQQQAEELIKVVLKELEEIKRRIGMNDACKRTKQNKTERIRADTKRNKKSTTDDYSSVFEASSDPEAAGPSKKKEQNREQQNENRQIERNKKEENWKEVTSRRKKQEERKNAGPRKTYANITKKQGKRKQEEKKEWTTPEKKKNYAIVVKLYKRMTATRP